MTCAYFVGIECADFVEPRIELQISLQIVPVHLLRGSAKQSVKDGLGSLWQHGNFNTSQLRNLWIYNDETLHV